MGSGFFGKPVKPVNRTRTSGLPKFREVSETSDSEGNRRYLPPAPQSLMVPLLSLLSSLHSAPPPLRVPDCRVTPSFMAGECMTWVSFFFVIFYSFEKFIFSHASRSLGIRSSRIQLATHHTHTQTVHPISLIIIQKRSFPPPTICLGSRRPQQRTSPSLAERLLPSHHFGRSWLALPLRRRWWACFLG